MHFLSLQKADDIQKFQLNLQTITDYALNSQNIKRLFTTYQSGILIRFNTKFIVNIVISFVIYGTMLLIRI